MRVIAGDYGGRTLHPPRGRDFRPTTDRVKETMFNILSNRVSWEDARVCDLFAGSGSLGIEALSRGAGSAVFVEKDRDSLAVLKANIAALHLEDRCTVVPLPVERWLTSNTTVFDVVFADPPYNYSAYDALLLPVAEGRCLVEDGVLCIEHARGTQFDDAVSGVRLDSRIIGDTALTFVSRSESSPEETR